MTHGSRPAPGFARNPERKITVAPIDGQVVAKAGDVVVAASTRAKRLEEDGLPPVVYIPFDDIAFANLERTDTRTHCPYKGDASYWRLCIPNSPGGDAMWAYEDPYDEMRAIKDHGAFDTQRVRVETSG